MRRLATIAVTAALVAARVAPAIAAPTPTDDDGIALIAPPAALEAAVIAQLGPWRITIVTVPGPAPTDAAGAWAVATHLQVRAVVWLVGDEVVIFDARDGHQLTRPLGALDPAGAAAIALSIKTVVRGPTQVAPAVVSEPAPLRPPPLPLVASSVRIAPPPRPAMWHVTLMGGLRWHAAGVEPRLAIAGARRLGPITLGLVGSLGAGVDTSTVAFAGTWHDRTLGARVGRAFPRGGLALSIALGPSLHVTSIRGQLAAGGNAAQRHANLLGLDAEGAALWRRGSLAIGAVVGATWIPWRPRYTVGGAPVFTVGHGELEVGITVGVTR